MEWQPIETYDALKNRPKYAVFYFEAMAGRMGLEPTIEMSRRFGIRVCTHWMPLPEPPK
jgi:hypothetical protein